MSELRFHKELYAKAAVEDAIQVYGQFCTMKYVLGKTHHILKVSGPTEPVENLEDEIANYVLAESVKRS